MFEYNNPEIFKLTFPNMYSVSFYYDPNCTQFLLNNIHIKKLQIICGRSIISQSIIDCINILHLDYLEVNKCFFENNTLIINTFIPTIILRYCYLTVFKTFKYNFNDIKLSNNIKNMVNDFAYGDEYILVLK